MAVRESMTQIIDFVRVLMHDPAGANAQYSGEQIQEQLDLMRIYTNDRLSPCGEPIAGWQSDYRYWENDTQVSDGIANNLSPLSADPMHGYWTFGSNPAAVYASGWVHDPYGAAAELLSIWAGALGSEVTKFSADGSSYEFGSIKNEKLKLAAQYRAKSLTMGGVKSVRMVRDDLNA